jgi:hypothetical protein
LTFNNKEFTAWQVEVIQYIEANHMRESRKKKEIMDRACTNHEKKKTRNHKMIEKASKEITIGTKYLDRDIVSFLIEMGSPKPSPHPLEKGSSLGDKNKEVNKGIEQYLKWK